MSKFKLTKTVQLKKKLKTPFSFIFLALLYISCAVPIGGCAKKVLDKKYPKQIEPVNPYTKKEYEKAKEANPRLPVEKM